MLPRPDDCDCCHRLVLEAQLREESRDDKHTVSEAYWMAITRPVSHANVRDRAIRQLTLCGGVGSSCR